MSHTHQEEDTDPFLELEPQTLYHHEHEHRPHSHSHSNPHSHSHSHNTRGQVNEDHIDPSLHGGNNTGRTNTNRLTDFASHILGSQDGDQHDHDHDHGHDHDHDHADVQGRHELSFTGEGGVLESSNHGFHVMDHDHDHDRRHEEEEEVDEGEFEPHLEEEGEGEFIGEAQAQTPGPHSLDPVVNGQVAARAGRKRGAYGKRKRAGAGVDEVVIKKMNHKEVERKRRNNISDGIDQLVSQMAIPELEKAGKSVQLRKASEYMAELGERVGVLEKEVGDLRGEKLDLEANLALTSQRYTEEHERCTRYETLWRDAQDREAKGQFEIAQLLDEISQLRSKR